MNGQAAFVISYGKSGGLGCFVAGECTSLARGAAVIVETPRGLELGTVLCPASERQARLMGSDFAGRFVRCLVEEDRAVLGQHDRVGQQMFDQARALIDRLGLPLAVLDVDLLFEGTRAVLQFVGADDVDGTPLVQGLEESFAVEVSLENVGHAPAAEPDQHGCGKPDCGKTGSGGGCTSCGTGGGCSSCGSGHVDMKAYFAHLRTKMEANNQRTPLL